MECNQTENSGMKSMGIAVATGVAAGTAMGAATHHMGEWVAIGAAMGLVIAMIARKSSR